MNDEYEKLVLKGVRDYLSGEDHPRIKSVRLEGEAPDTEVVATIDDPSEKAHRDFTYEIYHPAFNTTGNDFPEAVGTLIAVNIEEDAEAAREPIDPVVAKAVMKEYRNQN